MKKSIQEDSSRVRHKQSFARKSEQKELTIKADTFIGYTNRICLILFTVVAIMLLIVLVCEYFESRLVYHLLLNGEVL